jgi:D-alanyl-lipoteichoic acid acyltransferase DltB (MBOAT superfamily)
VALISLGMFLLLCVSLLTFLIWLAVAVLSYFGLKRVLQSRPERRWSLLVVLIPLQLAALFYYKYSDFALNRVLGLGYDALRDLVIPVGLSFYTFQKIAFVVDVLAFKEPLPRFLDYMNFAGFFPQIVAGPIERKRSLLPQMENFQFRYDKDWINAGATWVVVGLFFKCALADNLAQWMPPFMDSTANAYMVWMANLIFGLRIYYDFSGYSLIALGLARCLGIRLTLNFVSPYCSLSFQEFWRRWHVTLSTWFRDYVYIPLGGSRVRAWAANLAIVFVVSGMWHGAGWNFVLWGGLHGTFLILYHLASRVKIPSLVGWLVTFLGTFLAWLCFYETRFGILCQKLKTTFTLSAYNAEALKAAAGVLNPGESIVLGSLLALAGATFLLELLSVRRRDEPYVLLRRPLAQLALVVLTVLLAPGKTNAFIYFAF